MKRVEEEIAIGHVSPARSLTRFEKVKLGELLSFTLDRAPALGLVLKINEDQDVLVGLLTGGNEPIPYVEWQSSSDRCVTHGSDWVLEPRAGVTQVIADQAPERRTGLLALSSRGWLMNFAITAVDQFGRFNWEWRDLKTMEEVKKPGHFMVHNGWTLWESEEERLRANGEPLLRYDAQEQRGQQ